VPTASQTPTAGASVRRRLFRGERRVLIAQRQLTFEIGDLFLGIGTCLRCLRQLPLALDQFTAESLVLSI
jgi:hypothetical protein